MSEGVIQGLGASQLVVETDSEPSQGEDGLKDNTSTGEVSPVGNNTRPTDKQENEKSCVSAVVNDVPVKTTSQLDGQVASGVSERKLAKEPSPSIYFSNEKEEILVKEGGSKPPKRMTKAERAAQEAIALFGGSDFGSLAVRKIDLKNQLKGEAEKWKKEDGKSKGEPARRPRTRLERAREEVAGKFRGTPLGEGPRKYPKVMLAKQLAKQNQQQKEAPVSVKRHTKVQRSRELATASFGGVSFDNLPVVKKPKMKLSITKHTIQKDEPKCLKPATHALARSEKARLEALATFGGNPLDDVLDGSKKRVARHTDLCRPTKRSKISNSKEEEEVESEDGADRNVNGNEKDNGEATAQS